MDTECLLKNLSYLNLNILRIKNGRNKPGLISSFLRNRWLPVVLDGKSSQEYQVNAGVPQGSILVPTFFLLYLNDPPDDGICNIAIYAADNILYSKCDQASILGNN